MTARLRRVAVCSPSDARWDEREVVERWDELSYLRRPDYRAAQAEHDRFCALLQEQGVEVIRLRTGSGVSLDTVYTQDPSFLTEHGAILLHMGRQSRAPETGFHRQMYQELQIPILGQIEAPGTMEAGDIVWLDSRTLLVGHGFRTNAEGIRQLSQLVSRFDLEVIVAQLPYGRGPKDCLHLTSLMSLLDEESVLVDLPWLAVTTVELLRSRGFRLIEIDAAERDMLACNVLSLGDRRVVAFAGTPNTAKAMNAAGFEVLTARGYEMGINGGGGPTCLTRPILRA